MAKKPYKKRGRGSVRYSPGPHALKDFFFRRKVTQKTIAENVGVSVVTINAWLNRIVPVPAWGEAALLELASRVVKVSGDLLSLEDQLKLHPPPESEQ